MLRRISVFLFAAFSLLYLTTCASSLPLMSPDDLVEELPNITLSPFVGISTISASDGHSMAIKSDGSLWAWGWNELGAVGDGTTEDRLSPVKIMDDMLIP